MKKKQPYTCVLPNNTKPMVSRNDQVKEIEEALKYSDKLFDENMIISYRYKHNEEMFHDLMIVPMYYLRGKDANYSFILGEQNNRRVLKNIQFVKKPVVAKTKKQTKKPTKKPTKKKS